MREMLSYLDSPAGPPESAASSSTHQHVENKDPAVDQHRANNEAESYWLSSTCSTIASKKINTQTEGCI